MFSAYVSTRQHTSAYVSIRQHTSAYVSIRQHTSAGRLRPLAASCCSLCGFRDSIRTFVPVKLENRVLKVQRFTAAASVGQRWTLSTLFSSFTGTKVRIKRRTALVHSIKQL
jgi:hypothetical protein